MRVALALEFRQEVVPPSRIDVTMPKLRILPERPYRELPGLVGRLNRLNRWAGRADVRPLREDELIIYEGGSAFVLAGLESLSRWQRWT